MQLSCTCKTRRVETDCFHQLKVSSNKREFLPVRDNPIIQLVQRIDYVSIILLLLLFARLPTSNRHLPLYIVPSKYINSIQSIPIMAWTSYALPEGLKNSEVERYDVSRTNQTPPVRVADEDAMEPEDSPDRAKVYTSDEVQEQVVKFAGGSAEQALEHVRLFYSIMGRRCINPSWAMPNSSVPVLLNLDKSNASLTSRSTSVRRQPRSASRRPSNSSAIYWPLLFSSFGRSLSRLAARRRVGST